MNYLPQNIGNLKLQMYNPNQVLMASEGAHNNTNDIVDNRMQPYTQNNNSLPKAYNYENFEGYRTSGQLELPNGNNLVLSGATENITLPIYASAKTDAEIIKESNAKNEGFESNSYNSQCGCGCEQSMNCNCPVNCPSRKMSLGVNSSSNAYQDPSSSPSPSAVGSSLTENFSSCSTAVDGKYRRPYDDQNTVILSNGANTEIINESGVHNVTCSI